MQKSVGCRAESDTFLYRSCCQWSLTRFSIQCSFRVSDSFYWKYNFQRRMSRLEQRWRAQRSVISIVNCRIPWTNRDLNVYCAFGLFLKACLLQCLLIFMPLTHAKSLGAVMGACLCVKEFCPWRIEYTGSVTNEQLNKHSLVSLLLYSCWLIACSSSQLWAVIQDMKLGQQTRWI